MMKNRLTTAAIAVGALTLALSGGATASAAGKKCTTTGYTKNCGGCKTLPASGKFSITVPSTKVSVKGSGSTSAKGTTVCLAKIAPPVASKGGIGLRVTATGHFNPLKPAKGTLYRYTPKNKKLTKTASIQQAGIYQITGV